MTMKLKTALIQFRPETGLPEKNLATIDRMFRDIEDVQLIVLPELASSGYNFSGFDEALACSEATGSSGYLDFLREKASEKGAWIVSGFNERAGDKLFNSSAIINAHGVQAVYRKSHLFMNEKDIFQPGDGELPVVDIGGCRIGMTICFDYLFPEIWRMQAMRGADIICHPSNLLTQNAHRCIPGLSLMNRVFILTANRIGEDRGLVFNGQSFVTNPAGEVLVKGSVNKEEIITVEFDPEEARNKWVTARNHAFDDRRPEIYALNAGE